MIVVFAGPSIDEASVHEALGGRPARVLPPAAHGDLYRAWRRRPDAIVLIDGYFGDVAAVWHKEILWALSEGTPVLGGASIGALRAAELQDFGMVGVGEIFEAYRDGRLVADDEVALAHGDACSGYRALSEPLVNIRATLRRATTEGVIGDGTAQKVLEVARGLHYTDRSFQSVLALISDTTDTDRLRAWLPHGRVNQKAVDAKATLRAALTAGAPVPLRAWAFQYTAMWDEVTRLHASRGTDPHAREQDDILVELERDTAAYRSVGTAALARLLAGDLARRTGRAVDADTLLTTLADLRRRHSLYDPSQLDDWMTDNDLSADGLALLLTSEVHLQWALQTLADDLEPQLLDELRITGRYLAGRANITSEPAGPDAAPHRHAPEGSRNGSRPGATPPGQDVP